MNKKKSKYTFRGKEYNRIADICAEYSISNNTVFEYVTKGLVKNSLQAVEMALQKREERKIHHREKVFLSISEALRYYDLSWGSFKDVQRNHMGESKEKLLDLALERKEYREKNGVTWSNISKDAIVVEGKEYASMSQACKAYNVRLSTVSNRTNNHNETVEQAILGIVKRSKHRKTPTPAVFFDEEYATLKEACSLFQISFDTFHKRVDAGKGREESIMLKPLGKGNRICDVDPFTLPVSIAKHEWDSVYEMAVAVGYKKDSIFKMQQEGMSMNDILKKIVKSWARANKIDSIRDYLIECKKKEKIDVELEVIPLKDLVSEDGSEVYYTNASVAFRPAWHYWKHSKLL